MAALIYALSFKGAASPTVRAAFLEYELETEDGVTWVRCPRDRLSVVITLIQDLGLELLEVRMLARPDDAGPPERGASSDDSELSADRDRLGP